MKKICMLFLLACMTCLLFAQPKQQPTRVVPTTTQQITNDSISSLISVHQLRINLRIDSIRTDINTIKNNTKPQTIFGKFIENVLLQKSYEFFFGGSEKRG